MGKSNKKMGKWKKLEHVWDRISGSEEQKISKQMRKSNYSFQMRRKQFCVRNCKSSK